MKKKYTVTVGIPAYNEEANIGKLLKEILNQSESGFVLEKIIVASDGSTDKTVSIARKVNNKKIKVLNNKTRKGAANRQNQIMNLAKSDILVLLNADVTLSSKSFINNLTSPIIKNNADLASCRLLPLKPQNFFEKILSISVLAKTEMMESYKNGENLYTCHGAARAFSKKLYKKMRFIKGTVSEDAYSYLWAKTNGYKYKYTKSACAFYKLPSNLTDHQKQSVRFYQGQSKLEDMFNRDLIEREHAIPRQIYFKTMGKYAIIHPVESLIYRIILTYTQLSAKKLPEVKPTWDIAESTRTLN